MRIVSISLHRTQDNQPIDRAMGSLDILLAGEQMVAPNFFCVYANAGGHNDAAMQKPLDRFVPKQWLGRLLV
jgi:hypothetical protein